MRIKSHIISYAIIATILSILIIALVTIITNNIFSLQLDLNSIVNIVLFFFGLIGITYFLSKFIEGHSGHATDMAKALKTIKPMSNNNSNHAPFFQFVIGASLDDATIPYDQRTVGKMTMNSKRVINHMRTSLWEYRRIYERYKRMTSAMKSYNKEAISLCNGIKNECLREIRNKSPTISIVECTTDDFIKVSTLLNYIRREIGGNRNTKKQIIFVNEMVYYSNSQLYKITLADFSADIIGAFSDADRGRVLCKEIIEKVLLDDGILKKVDEYENAQKDMKLIETQFISKRDEIADRISREKDIAGYCDICSPL